jgi:vacuolar-type H+-ATPase subunit I/STV1
MKIKNKLLITIGQFLLILSFVGFLINNLLLDNNSIIAFIIGILMGMSLVFNLTFLVIMNKNRK